MNKTNYYEVWVYRGAVKPCGLKALLERLRAAGEMPVVYTNKGRKVKA